MGEMVLYYLRRVKENGALVIYIIDNDKSYELHRLYFVESPAPVMEPLIDLMQRAWRRTCYGCGKERAEVAVPKCPDRRGPHEFRENPFLCGTSPQIDWLAIGSGGGQKNLDVAQFLWEIVESLRDEVADLAAAREFIRIGSGINADVWWEKFDLTEDK